MRGASIPARRWRERACGRIPNRTRPRSKTQRPQAPLSRFDEAALFRDPYTVLSDIAGAPPRIAQAGADARSDAEGGAEGRRGLPRSVRSHQLANDVHSPLEEKAPGQQGEWQPPAQRRGRGAHRRARSSSVRRQARRDGDASSEDPIQPKPPWQSQTSRKRLKPVGLIRRRSIQGQHARQSSICPASRRRRRRRRTPAIQAAGRHIRSACISRRARPVAEVRETNEGLLINLTDDVNYGMFANGSAEPTPGLVRALDKITPLISQNRGQVIVRGHTDNRAYRIVGVRQLAIVDRPGAHGLSHADPRRTGRRGASNESRAMPIAARKIRTIRSAAQNRRIELLIRAPTP